MAQSDSWKLTASELVAAGRKKRLKVPVLTAGPQLKCSIGSQEPGKYSVNFGKSGSRSIKFLMFGDIPDKS